MHLLQLPLILLLNRNTYTQIPGFLNDVFVAVSGSVQSTRVGQHCVVDVRFDRGLLATQPARRRQRRGLLRDAPITSGLV